MSDPTMTESHQERSEQPNAELPYISPTLKHLDERHRPEPSPACETCPAALWFTTSELLKCFCRQMHLIVWDGKETPILKCDGRELAILALLEQKNG